MPSVELEDSVEDSITGQKRAGALRMGSRKKQCVLFTCLNFLNFECLFGSCGTDPLVHHGRHFGRTVHALCTVSSLVNNGIIRMGELATQPDKMMTEEYAIPFICSPPHSRLVNVRWQGVWGTSRVQASRPDDIGAWESFGRRLRPRRCSYRRAGTYL
jgi:hypothetical protein